MHSYSDERMGSEITRISHNIIFKILNKISKAEKMVDSPHKISSVENELAERAPTKVVIQNWRLWWLPIGITLLAFFLLLTGIFLSLEYTDWTFLSRFGALIVVSGSYLIGRPVWRRRFKSRFVTATVLIKNQISNEQFAEYIQERTDIWFFYVGFTLAALGSVVWGFSDLANCLFSEPPYHCPL